MNRTYRVYFNQTKDAPQVWSVDDGHPDSEINVQGVVVSCSAVARTRFDPTATPRAWLEVRGELWVDAGVAFIGYVEEAERQMGRPYYMTPDQPKPPLGFFQRLRERLAR